MAELNKIGDSGPLFPPRAYIIGAQKAGTSTLSAVLSQHPAINLARHKEPHFFSANWERGMSWYRAQFDDKPGASILLDASPSYAMAPVGLGDLGLCCRGEYSLKIPERMKAVRPDARLIYILRDPADRIYSSYWQAVRSGYEKRTINAAVKENPEYVCASMYFAQIEHFLEQFSMDSFLFLSFRDFVANPAAVAQQCLRFLAAEPTDFRFSGIKPRNSGFRYNLLGRWLKSIAGSEKTLSRVTAVVRDYLPDQAYRTLAGIFSRPLDRMDPQLRGALQGYVREDYARLVALTGLSL